MKTRASTLLGGLILILLGGFALAFELGYLQDLSEQTWMMVFGAASILFWATYFVSGVRSWGWLFPACIFAALSGSLYIADTSVADEWIATLVVGSVVIPFVVGYLLDRSRWALLIPAFILAFVAIIPPLSISLAGEWMGMFIVGMIGLPFLAAYLVTPKAWWAIFPSGGMLSIAVMIALTGLQFDFDTGTFAVSVMFLGWMLTFGLAWLRRSTNPTDWAKYPAIAMAVLAFIMFMVTAGLEVFWSIGLIIAGMVIVLLGLRPHRDQLDEA